MKRARAELTHAAALAVGLDGPAYATPVEDEDVARLVPALAREKLAECTLDGLGLGLAREFLGVCAFLCALCVCAQLLYAPQLGR